MAVRCRQSNEAIDRVRRSQSTGMRNSLPSLIANHSQLARKKMSRLLNDAA
jgi:hypothetical protein